MKINSDPIPGYKTATEPKTLKTNYTLGHLCTVD